MSFKPGLTLSIANSFNHFAKRTSRTAGHPQTFGLALAVTTIVTFLMVFLIQNTQNRDSVGDADQARRAGSAP